MINNISPTKKKFTKKFDLFSTDSSKDINYFLPSMSNLKAAPKNISINDNLSHNKKIESNNSNNNHNNYNTINI